MNKEERLFQELRKEVQQGIDSGISPRSTEDIVMRVLKPTSPRK